MKHVGSPVGFPEPVILGIAPNLVSIEAETNSELGEEIALLDNVGY